MVLPAAEPVSVLVMPAGLDGNPNPVVTDVRSTVLQSVADSILDAAQKRVIVGVDGQPGSGKSTFGDELASAIRARGVSAVRSTTDSFHRPRAQRMAQGPTSPEGFYADSHQLNAIVSELLRPFAQGVDRVRVAAFDEPTDQSLDEFCDLDTAARIVLIFDGLFLHRPELEAWWDHSIFLDADQRRDQEWVDFLLSELPDAATAKARAIDERLQRARWPRYRSGWAQYIASADPVSKASIVIDNNNIGLPHIIARAATSS